jgi:peptidoglycan/LPS O-acetylase OafA/YrhL
MPDLSKYKPTKIFSWLGQHSLAIYLVHQPVIAGVLFLVVMI